MENMDEKMNKEKETIHEQDASEKIYIDELAEQVKNGDRDPASLTADILMELAKYYKDHGYTSRR